MYVRERAHVEGTIQLGACMQDSDADEEGSHESEGGDGDNSSWVSIDDQEMSAEEDWATVDHSDGYSDATPRAQDLSALTATPDTMSECSMHTAVGLRGNNNLYTQSNSSISAQFGGPGAHAHMIPTMEHEAPLTTGLRLYENATGNITLTESEPHSVYTAVSSGSGASRTSVAPNNSVYGNLSSEELDDVFGDVNEHPNDLVIDGMRRLNGKYIALKKVGEVRTTNMNGSSRAQASTQDNMPTTTSAAATQTFQ